MHAATRPPLTSELKQMVREASLALAHLDADRLEDLARACAALNRDWRVADAIEQAEIARQARQAAADMAIFARVLDATRANLNVLRRLRDLRMGRIEYGASGPRRESHHGID